MAEKIQITTTEDATNPKHYSDHPSGVECYEITQHHDFLVGNIIKYAWRCGKKKSASRLEDLKKCAWYAQRAVELEQGKAKK